MAGQSGKYKSFIALDIAARVADGRGLPHYIDRDEIVMRVPTKQKVIYCLGEGSAGTPKRIRAAGLESTEMMFLTVPWPILDDVKYTAFNKFIRSHNPDIVVLDTMQMFRTGGKTGKSNDENSSEAIGEFYSRLSSIKNIHWLIVHHSGKGNVVARGSSAIQDDASNVWWVKGQHKATTTATVKTVKLRDLEPMEFSVKLEMNEEVGSLYVAGYNTDPVDLAELYIDIAKEEKQQ